MPLRPPVPAERHTDLAVLERLDARQALLVFNEQVESLGQGDERVTVEELSFAWVAESASRAVGRGGKTASTTAGAKDVRRFVLERHTVSPTSPGASPIEWNRLSVQVESGGTGGGPLESACGRQAPQFESIRNRALATVDFFQQVLYGIDPDMVTKGGQHLTTIRQRVAAWLPIDQVCDRDVLRRRTTYPPTSIVVSADLVREEAHTGRRRVTRPSPLEIRFEPILFRHAQPASLQQTKDVLLDPSVLEAAAATLGSLLAAPVDTDKLPRLLVCGHADSTGNPDGRGQQMNLALSQRRAQWVIQQLRDRVGPAVGALLLPHGCGDAFAPAGGKASPAHRAVVISAATLSPGTSVPGSDGA